MSTIHVVAAASAQSKQIERDVYLLSGEIGERHDGDAEHHAHLRAAADHIEARFAATHWSTRREVFRGESGRAVENVAAERRGTRSPGAVVIVGAHYDSIRGGPGADDNASGVAALLALAGTLPRDVERTVRLVAFANEERPHTRRRTMGSLVHARACRAAGERVVAMLSLECLGFHVRRADAAAPRGDLTLFQRIAPIWTDSTFVVTNVRSRHLGDALARSLREGAPLHVRRLVAPGFLPLVRSSDHWSFWKNGYPAAMLTDAAPLRYRHYHRDTDSFERIDVRAIARITRGLTLAIDRLARGGAS